MENIMKRPVFSFAHSFH